MLDLKTRHGVVIVGAGPVGMLLALELRLAGLVPTIISRPLVDSPHSKATIFWPRILELLDRTDVTPEILAAGHCFEQMNYYSNKKLVGRMCFSALRDTDYPFGITIPQWKTEDILRRALERAGIPIHYGVEFRAAVQDEHGVRARIQVEGGESAELRCDYLVGADGFRSKVRDSFAFGFHGFSFETRLAITDTELIGETTSNEVAYYLHRAGNMVVAPLGDGIFRVGASVPKDMAAAEEPGRDFFERLLAERTPGHRRLGKMRFSGVFVAHVRTAQSFRLGRVFLVGDAAHAMSPSGAQGMNTGIQDAVNLGWKLGGVVAGRLPAALLDTYSTERFADVGRVSALSTRLARMSLYRGQPKIFARDAILRVASWTGGLDRLVVPRISQLDSETGDPAQRLSSRGRLRVGQRLPIGWTQGGIGPTLSKRRHTVLLWPGAAYSYGPWDHMVEQTRLTMPERDVVNLGGKPLGRLLGRLGREPSMIVVRPDGHIEEIAPMPVPVTRVPLAATNQMAV